VHTDDPSSWHKRSHGLDAIAAADKTVNNVARRLVMRNYRNNQIQENRFAERIYKVQECSVQNSTMFKKSSRQLKTLT
jgi:broad-specificity NMP kinase